MSNKDGVSGCEQHTQELVISVSILFFCLGEKGSFEGLKDSYSRKSKGAAKKWWVCQHDSESGGRTFG